MTNDIKKAIEEEIGRYLYETDGWTTKRCSMEYISNFILSKWEESTRWRKVEEELPEVKEEDYFILCRTNKSQKYSVVLIHCELDFRRYFRVFEITHWKPIH